MKSCRAHFFLPDTHFRENFVTFLFSQAIFVNMRKLKALGANCSHIDNADWTGPKHVHRSLYSIRIYKLIVRV
jgi:hypothetical protein